METGRRKILARELITVLMERGIIPPNTRRVVIDMNTDEPVILYYELIGDERLIEVFRAPAVRVEVKGPENE